MHLKFLKSSGPLNGGRKKAKHILNFRTNNDDIWTVNRREENLIFALSVRFTKEMIS